MNTITFATTQMNLINCVEYLSTINGNHTLFIWADSTVRQKQIVSFLQSPSYASVFKKIICCPKYGVRLFDYFLTLFFLLRLWTLSCVNVYQTIITGNYRNFGARFLYKLQKMKHNNCDFVVCDDGMATCIIAKARLVEIKTNDPYIFYPIHLIEFFFKNDVAFIPEQIIFFTSYNIPVGKNDTVIKNEYGYIKKHLTDFNVNKDVFNCNAIFIGQPLYRNGYVTSECFKNKLLQYSKAIKGSIIYYAHPVETKEEWSLLGIERQYSYLDNFLPFEIIAAILPKGCRVASFFSSVLVNLNFMNDSLIPECIPFNKEQLLNSDLYSSLEECYSCYRKENVKFHEFD